MKKLLIPFLLLSFVAAGWVCHAQAQTVQTKTQLKADINTDLASGKTPRITAADIRGVLTGMVDSMQIEGTDPDSGLNQAAVDGRVATLTRHVETIGATTTNITFSNHIPTWKFRHVILRSTATNPHTVNLLMGQDTAPNSFVQDDWLLLSLVNVNLTIEAISGTTLSNISQATDGATLRIAFERSGYRITQVAGPALTARHILDQAKPTRVVADRTKIVGVKSDDQNALELVSRFDLLLGTLPNPFTIPVNANLNDISIEGFYHNAGAYTNGPITGQHRDITLEVIHPPLLNIEVQIAFLYDGREFIRHLPVSGIWEPWEELTFDHDLLLPTLPATGSRDNKAPIFNGNTLGWETITAGTGLGADIPNGADLNDAAYRSAGMRPGFGNYTNGPAFGTASQWVLSIIVESANEVTQYAQEVNRTAGNRERVRIWNGTTWTAWTDTTPSGGGGGLTPAQLARLLPTLPAEGSRDNKVPKFAGNTLGWEEDSGQTASQVTAAILTDAPKAPRLIVDITAATSYLTQDAIDGINNGIIRATGTADLSITLGASTKNTVFLVYNHSTTHKVSIAASGAGVSSGYAELAPGDVVRVIKAAGDTIYFCTKVANIGDKPGSIPFAPLHGFHVLHDSFAAGFSSLPTTPTAGFLVVNIARPTGANTIRISVGGVDVHNFTMTTSGLHMIRYSVSAANWTAIAAGQSLLPMDQRQNVPFVVRDVTEDEILYGSEFPSNAPEAAGGGGSDANPNIPDAPARTAGAKSYELRVPATGSSDGITWNEAAAGGGSFTPSKSNLYDSVKAILHPDTQAGVSADDTNNEIDIAIPPTVSANPDGTPPTLISKIRIGTEDFSFTVVGNSISEGKLTDVVNRGIPYFVPATDVGGTADAITLTKGIPRVSAYAAGMMFRFLAEADNTGAVTINVNSWGVRTVVRADGSALAAGEIENGFPVTVQYDGTRFVSLINPPASGGGAAGVIVQDSGTQEGSGIETLNFGDNLAVTVAGGVATVTGQAGGGGGTGEENVNADWDASSGDAQILNRPDLVSVTSAVTLDSAADYGVYADTLILLGSGGQITLGPNAPAGWEATVVAVAEGAIISSEASITVAALPPGVGTRTGVLALGSIVALKRTGGTTFAAALIAPTDVPLVPAHASAAKQYMLGVPATAGNVVWTEATAVPISPATGSRNRKILAFNGDVLGWQDRDLPPPPPNAAVARQLAINQPANSGAPTWGEVRMPAWVAVTGVAGVYVVPTGAAEVVVENGSRWTAAITRSKPSVGEWTLDATKRQTLPKGKYVVSL